MSSTHPKKIFITGTGTGIGKTVIAAILAEAMQADYWKPVQAGDAGETDSQWVERMISNTRSVVHPEAYRLQLAASPHIAARNEHIEIDLHKIVTKLPSGERNLVVEGAGGLLVPLNESEFVGDLIRMMDIKVILISKNILGSINHSLLTAKVCREMGIPVMGWIFNDNYLEYEEEIVRWSGIPKLASVPFSKNPDRTFITNQAAALSQQLNDWPW